MARTRRVNAAPGALPPPPGAADGLGGPPRGLADLQRALPPLPPGPLIRVRTDWQPGAGGAMRLAPRTARGPRVTGGVAAGRGSGQRGARVGQERWQPYVKADGTVDVENTRAFVDRSVKALTKKMVQMKHVAKFHSAWYGVNDGGNSWKYATLGTPRSTMQILAATAKGETITAAKKLPIEFNAVDAIVKWHSDGTKARADDLFDALRAFGVSTYVLARAESELTTSFAMTSHLKGGKEKVFRELAVHIGQALDRYCDDDDDDEFMDPAEEHKEPEPAHDGEEDAEPDETDDDDDEPRAEYMTFDDDDDDGGNKSPEAPGSDMGDDDDDDVLA